MTNTDAVIKAVKLKTLLTKAELRVILIVLSLRQDSLFIYRRES